MKPIGVKYQDILKVFIKTALLGTQAQKVQQLSHMI